MFTPAAATAQQEPRAAELAPAEVAALGLSEAELQDLTRIAKQYDITLTQAIADYSWQDDFSASVKTISDKYPGEFAGAAIEDNSAWVGFKGELPTAVADAFAHSRVPVMFVTSRGFSEKELVDAVTTAVKQLHPYEIPCVVALPVDGGNPDYLAWLATGLEKQL